MTSGSNMPKFAANLTMMFNEVPFLQRFAAAAKAGFTAVEFLFPYECEVQQLARCLTENHLQNVLFNLPPGDWLTGERGLAALPGREEEFKASVALALEYARALGTPRLHVMAGIVPEGVSRQQCLETYCKNIDYAARELSQYGIDLMIEPINPRDMPGYLLNSQAEAHAIRKMLGRDNLKVQMDFYHAQIVEGDLSTTLTNNFDGIGHIQIASVPARNEPDDGEINYPYLFALLDKLGYRGWVGCEYRPRGKTEDGLAWLPKSV
jgi:hydroxypyruvate isomerase